MTRQNFPGLMLSELVKFLGSECSLLWDNKTKITVKKPIRMVLIQCLLLASILVTSQSNAQSRLGFSKKEILEEFEKYNPEFEMKDDGRNYVHFGMDRAVVFQYFNEKDICDMSIIVPRESDDLNFFVQFYNEQYVVLNDRNWKMYSENGTIASIELVHHDGLTFFVWK